MDCNRFLVIVDLAVVHCNEGLPVLEDLSPSIVLGRQHLYGLCDVGVRGPRARGPVIGTVHMRRQGALTGGAVLGGHVDG